uniref:IRS-type PTB domain-containing protein n=1 Tax=Salarias fasciatus TaxID=181472 RepID=A0A672I7A3_SALFA
MVVFFFFQLTFTIEAGRRCETGPGTFTFETPQAEKIFSLIQSFIKRKTSSPLPQEGDGIIIAVPVENRLGTPDGNSPVMEDTPKDSLKSAPAPITLMPLPSVPTHDSPSAGRRNTHLDVIYADPADCIQSVIKRQPTTALYVDPASVLPLKPPGSAVTSLPTAQPPPFGLQGEPMDSEYSEVYDRVSPNRSNPAESSTEGTARRPTAEPIYDDPMSNNEEPAKQATPDPFSHLYAKVCKRGRSPSPNAINSAHDDDDVIYENLGII